jgi:LPXTG-motif cell wall-anchored protein
MGGVVNSVKSVAKAVVAPVVKPINSAVQSVVQKTGVQDAVKNTVGIDINNMVSVVGDTAQLQGSTGSSKFKNAAFDAAKIGVAVSTGGAGSALSYGQGAAGFIALSKVQAGKPLTIGDVAGAGGVGTNIDTGLGNVDVGGFKLPSFGGANGSGQGISSLLPSFGSSSNGSGSSNNNSILILGAGLIAIIAVVLIVRKK